MTRTAVGYIRVSTADQRDNGVSIDAQRLRIERWCAADGYDLVDVFDDAGLSGKRADNRPGLQLALDRVCETNGAALVVYSLSRLARSTKDAIGIAERLDKAGADLVSLSEKIDTTTAAGRMVFRMLAVLSEFERDIVSERTAAALGHMKACGRRVGTIPFGHDLAGDGTTLIPNPEEQQAINIIHSMRRSGAKLKEIAAELTSQDIATKRGNAIWSHQSVSQILRRSPW